MNGHLGVCSEAVQRTVDEGIEELVERDRPLLACFRRMSLFNCFQPGPTVCRLTQAGSAKPPVVMGKDDHHVSRFEDGLAGNSTYSGVKLFGNLTYLVDPMDDLVPVSFARSVRFSSLVWVCNAGLRSLRNLRE